MSFLERRAKINGFGSDYYGGPRLCEDAEPRLRRSLANGAVMLVDDVFMVKFTGRLCGLALKDAIANNGYEIKAGHWYSPVGDTARGVIKDAFDHRRVKLNAPAYTQWAHMRDAHGLRFNLLLARLVAIDLRLHITGKGKRRIGLMTRQQYRERKKE